MMILMIGSVIILVTLIIMWWRIETRKRPFCRDCGADTILTDNQRVCPSCGWKEKKPSSMSE